MLNKEKIIFFDKLYRNYFFSVITIILFDSFLIIFSEKTFDKVSIVFPDFEIIIKRTFDRTSFFLNSIILFSSISLKK